MRALPRRPTSGPTRSRSTNAAITTVTCILTACLTVAACAGTSDQQVAAKGSDAATTSTSESTTSTTAAPDCASMLPTTALASQMLVVMTPDPSNAAEALQEGKVGGLGLKGNQRSDVGDVIAEITADTPLPAIVAVDEEGGSVQRLRFSAGRFPSAEEVAEGDPETAGAEMAEHAARMADLGVTMNFAPVADIGEGSDLGSRTYGDDPDSVSPFVNAMVAANLQGGITPVVKHWPGIGGGDTDPHEALTTLAPIDQLRTNDMVPFDRAIEAGAPAIMVAHAEVPGLTAAGEPASLSRDAITGELREREGFDGLVISDSLGMGAVVNSVPQDEATERTIAAGADIALLSGVDVIEAAHARLVDAIDTERIPAEQVEESVRRILALKGIEGECFDVVSAYAGKAREEADAAADAQAEADAAAKAQADAEVEAQQEADAEAEAEAETGTDAEATTTTAEAP